MRRLQVQLAGVAVPLPGQSLPQDLVRALLVDSEAVLRRERRPAGGMAGRPVPCPGGRGTRVVSYVYADDVRHFRRPLPAGEIASRTAGRTISRPNRGRSAPTAGRAGRNWTGRDWTGRDWTGRDWGTEASSVPASSEPPARGPVRRSGATSGRTDPPRRGRPACRHYVM